MKFMKLFVCMVLMSCYGFLLGSEEPVISQENFNQMLIRSVNHAREEWTPDKNILDEDKKLNEIISKTMKESAFNLGRVITSASIHENCYRIDKVGQAIANYIEIENNMGVETPLAFSSVFNIADKTIGFRANLRNDN